MVRWSAALVLATLLAGCGSDECQSDADCPGNRVCKVGLCALNPSADGGPVGLDVDLPCDPAVEGDLVLNEIMADPAGLVTKPGEVDTDSTRNEFIEVVNVSDHDVAITSVMLQVSKTTTKTVYLGPVCLAPNEARVIYGFDTSLGLVNSGATVSLWVDGAVVQTHTYAAEGGKGESLTLAQQLNPDSGWVLHSEVGEGTFSAGLCANQEPFPDCSQGFLSDGADGGLVDGVSPCGDPPESGELMINEILADPSPSLDANQDGTVTQYGDEYVEIVNISGRPIHLGGATVSEAGGNTFEFPYGSCLQPYQATLIFGEYAGGGDFGGAVVFGLGGSFKLNNDTDTVSLAGVDGEILATVTYTSGAGDDQAITREPDLSPQAEFKKHKLVAGANGAPMSPGFCSNGNAFPACAGVVVADATDGGLTPDGDVGPSCGSLISGAGSLMLNEILAKPGGLDVNNDGESSTKDEFVEIVNVSGQELDLTGVQLFTGQGTPSDLVHTFQGFCLGPLEGVVLFGGGNPGFTVDKATIMVADKSLSLNDAAGHGVRLVAGNGVEVDAYTYQLVPASESLTRWPDGTGAFAPHSEADTEAGKPFSPGSCIDGSPFPFCLE